MNKVDVETRILLDKIYNLKGEDSVVLTKMEQEREEAEATKRRTSEEKLILIEKIDKLNDDEVLLVKEGKLLQAAINNIEKKEFGIVFDMLQIDFDASDLAAQVKFGMPLTQAELKDEITESNNELEIVVKEMNDAITKIEELAIRRETALNDQVKLSEFVSLAITGNSNITRESLASLLSRFDLSKEEQKECAKILMFPEDGLFEYNERNNRKSGISISEVFADAKSNDFTEKKLINDLSVEKKLEEKEFKFEPIDFNVDINEDFMTDEPVADSLNLFDENIKPFSIDFEELKEPVFEEKTKEVNLLEPQLLFAEELFKNVEEPEVSNDVFEDYNPIVIPEPMVIENVSLEEEEENDINFVNSDSYFEPITIPDLPTVKEVTPKFVEDVDFHLKENGFELSDFSDNDLKFIKDNFNLIIFEKNIKIVKDMGLNFDLFKENVELLVDRDLDSKLNELINIGKVPFDIYLNPNILIRYTLEELVNAINQLKESGLDPKKVPLMAF